MRTFYFLLLLMPYLAMEQPNNKEILRIKSVNAITEMNAIVNPSAGCLVFISSNQTIYYYDGSSWVSIGNPWFINGNQCQNNHFLGTTNNQDLPFRTNNLERLTIKDDGKVGIGTNTPEARFQVGESNEYTEDILTFYNTNSTIVANNYHFVYVDNNLITNGVVYANQEIQYNGTLSDPKIVTAYSIRITDFNLLTSFTFMGRLNDVSNWVTLDQQTNVSWPANYYLELTFNNTTVYEDYKIVFNTVNYTQNQACQLVEIEFLEHIKIQPAFTVEDNGRTGVNMFPANERLQVGGNILADAFTPDYVFEHHFNGYSEQYPNYSQLTLKETKDFIKKHKHLPGLPSAKDIQKQGGIIINQAVDANLEKIEELYLHLFELNHRMKKLEHLIAEKENIR